MTRQGTVTKDDEQATFLNKYMFWHGSNFCGSVRRSSEGFPWCAVLWSHLNTAEPQTIEPNISTITTWKFWLASTSNGRGVTMMEYVCSNFSSSNHRPTRIYYSGVWPRTAIAVYCLFIFYMIRTNAIDRNISSDLVPRMTCFWDISHLQTSSLIRRRVKASEIPHQRFQEGLFESNALYIDISPQTRSFAFRNYKPSQVTTLEL